MSSRSTVGIATIWLLVLCGVARAQTTKTFINYFQSTPTTCALTTNAWGCTATGSTPPNCVSGQGVVPRDTCNGIESATNPPGYYYWDGTVILAPDGTFHMFADRWVGSRGSTRAGRAPIPSTRSEARARSAPTPTKATPTATRASAAIHTTGTTARWSRY